MQPGAEEFAEWLGHPVTEWVMACMRKAADSQKQGWADLAWQEGQVDVLALTEARVRADSYHAIPESAFEDWKAIDDSED